MTPRRDPSSVGFMSALYSIRMHLCASEGLELVKATAWRSLLSTSIQISERDEIPTPQKGKYLHLQKSRRIPRGFIRLSHPIIKANRNYCPDLGCGHGLLARYLPLSFANVLGTDPSSGMVALGSIVNGHSSGTCEKSCAERLLSYPTTALELLL